jgi:hypothetical protein
MDELIKALPSVLRSVGYTQEIAEAAALAAWKHAAGEGLKDHAVPMRLEDRTLVVAVPDKVWQKQLGTMRGQLLFRVNSLLGQPIVSRIEFLVDPETARVRAQPKKERNDVLDNEVPLELWSAANAIHDKQLRQKFLKAAIGMMKRQQTNNNP